MDNLSPVTTLDELRDSLGEPHPLVTKKIITSLDDVGRRFIELSPFLMLSTADADGFPDVSPRGDDPGFVHIRDERTLYLPERPGNKLIFSLQNILANPNVALLFMIPGVTETYRVHGTACIVSDTEILNMLEARGQAALMAIEVKIKRCFLHCGKSMMRSRLWKMESQQKKSSFRFGATTAKQAGGDKDMADMIDKLVAEDYRDNL